MFAALSSFQFAHAASLLLGAAIPVLIFAYITKNQRKKKVVSSVLILKTLPKRTRVRRKIKLPLRFFLELLALLLLTLAFAEPFIKSEGEKIALVFDTSLSMRAVLSDPLASGNRWQKAVATAEDWLDNRDSSDLVSFFRSAPQLKLVGEEFIPPGSVSSLIKTLEPTTASDSLSVAVNELARSGVYDRVVVVSDRELAYTSAGDGGSLFSRGSTVIKGLQVGKPVANAYIANLEIERTSVERLKNTLKVSVGLSGLSDYEVVLRIFGVRTSGGTGVSLGPELAKDSLSLTANETTSLRFPFKDSFRRYDAYKVTLTAPSSSRSVLNSLHEDDTGWISRESAPGAKLLVIAPFGAPQTSYGLNRIAGLEVDTKNPKEYTALTADARKEYSLLVFYRTAPTRAPQQATLLILPPADNPLFPVRTDASGTSITSWADDHQITSYLKVPLLKPGGARIFDVPPWAQAVINVEPGSLLVAGESRGIRFAAVGFEILPFEGRSTPTLSILTLNLFHWLTGGSELGGRFLSGTNFRLAPNKQWIIRDPMNQLTTLDAAADETLYPLLIPGLYEITASGSAGIDKRNITVNSFYPEESATWNQAHVTVQQQDSVETAPAPTSRFLWQPLLLLALIILLIESVLYVLEKPEQAT